MAFTAGNLSNAKYLAERLLSQIAAVQRQLDDEADPNSLWVGRTPYPSRATGALRRTSMDLTRALADLRRS